MAAGPIETWVNKWWKDHEKEIKRDGGRIVTSVYRGAERDAGSGAIGCAFVTAWIHRNVVGGKSEDLAALMKKGLKQTSIHLATRQIGIVMRQEKHAAKHKAEIDQLGLKLEDIERLYFSEIKEEHHAAANALHVLSKAINGAEGEMLTELLASLVGGGNLKLERAAMGEHVSRMGERIYQWSEERGGHYLMLLRPFGTKNLGSTHVLGFEVAPGRWSFLDPSSIEVQFQSSGSLKQFVTDFCAAFYKKTHEIYDLYEYVHKSANR